MSPRLLRSDAELDNWLTSPPLSWKVLLIDGFTGSGKSTLAERIGSTFGIAVIHLDDLTSGQLGEVAGTYVELLDQARLANAMRQSDQVILDGVTAMDVAAIWPQTQILLLYVKRYTVAGEWADKYEIEPDPTIESYAPPNRLMRLVRSYHHRVRPHEICDAVYIWTEAEC